MKGQNRTRRTPGVRSGVDTGRLAAAVSRPGIDPRVWFAYGTVLELGYDPQNGIYADVKLPPGEDIETVLVGTEYAPNNGGMYWPILIGDVLLCAFPMGDPQHGGVIVKRVWSAQRVPPPEMAGTNGDPTNNPVLRIADGTTWEIYVENGANIQFNVSGSGKVSIAAKGQATVELTGESTVIVNSPDVRLGDSPGSPIARVGDIVMVTAANAVGSPAAVPPIVPGVTQWAGQILSGKQGVKA